MACQRALKFNTILYRSVKDILEKDLDANPLIEQTGRVQLPCFKYARDHHEYQSEKIVIVRDSTVTEKFGLR